ncbi:mediator of RNA polymerase II transcription subunit 19 isoform X2 [Exaiptasia diaphana]|uniref:Mediator of RNA polymerase II transcription subunit 19 n=1 Tax=Exaiptasia diaphana TaxID=2652724 RepID=A0A913WTN4_EXADI|nr:mediator of RNA polymerase II transcription subunit 19 isoform X2 [Exaiptasia diaphana]
MVSTSATPTPSTQTSSSSFYLLRNEVPATPSEATGSTNLLVEHGLQQVYHKFCSKKVKDSLSAFLPLVSGYVDEKGSTQNSLQSVVDKPPVGGKELIPLPSHALSGFRLNPGPIPEQFRFMSQQPLKKKHRHKKHKSHDSDSGKNINDTTGPKTEQYHDTKKHKKQKKHDDGERKKKKKEKKKKKDKS